MKWTCVFASAWLLSCAGHLPESIELKPQGEDVEIAAEPPSPDAYQLVGEVTGQAAANDIELAQEAARNDLRNNAAALGAVVVTIDSNVGEPLLLIGKTKVKLVGRAFKPAD